MGEKQKDDLKVVDLLRGFFPSAYRRKDKPPSGYYDTYKTQVVIRKYPYPDSLRRFRGFVCLCGSQIFRKWQFVTEGVVTASYRCWKCDGMPILLDKKMMAEMGEALAWLGYQEGESV